VLKTKTNSNNGFSQAVVPSKALEINSCLPNSKTKPPKQKRPVKVAGRFYLAIKK
jgi:hypothetical protein